MPKNLTVTTLGNVKAAEDGKRRELFDVQAPGLCLRVTDRGHKAYYWRGRIKGRVQPVRVHIGDPKIMGIGEARKRARLYAEQAANGDDPRLAIRAEEEKQARDNAAKFELVAERYIAGPVAKMARPTAVTALIKRYLVPEWTGRPIVTISDEDVASVISKIKKTGKYHTATSVLAYCKTLFGWAASLEQRKETGLYNDPCAKITADNLNLKIEARSVALSDDQLRIVWNAAGTLAEPWGSFTRFLILSGQRRTEVGDMAWSEINLQEKEWLIPAARMKGKRGKRRDHLVPLTEPMVAILEQIKASQPKGAKYVFSTANGKKPVSSYSDAKTALDKAVAEMAPDAGLPEWRFHDLRRTVRTGLAKMEKEIPATIAERVLAHIQGGIEGVYNVHNYAEEKRDALTRWNARLDRIVNPPSVGGNVVAFSQAAQ